MLDQHGETPLAAACFSKKPKLVDLLLQWGASPMKRVRLRAASGQEEDYLPLHSAAIAGSREVISLLHAHEPGSHHMLAATSFTKMTALHYVCRQQKLDLALFLVSLGGGAESNNAEGRAPSHLLSNRADRRKLDGPSSPLIPIALTAAAAAILAYKQNQAKQARAKAKKKPAVLQPQYLDALLKPKEVPPSAVPEPPKKEDAKLAPAEEDPRAQRSFADLLGFKLRSAAVRCSAFVSFHSSFFRCRV
jgi:hypothetical protein